MIIPFLISAWAAVSFSLYFQEFTRLYTKIRILGWQPFNRKPFNCEACLPFWLVAAFLPFAIYVHYGVPTLAALATGCSAGIITALITKKVSK
jgi:hypothetical protein